MRVEEASKQKSKGWGGRLRITVGFGLDQGRLSNEWYITNLLAFASSYAATQSNLLSLHACGSKPNIYGEYPRPKSIQLQLK